MRGLCSNLGSDRLQLDTIGGVEAEHAEKPSNIFCSVTRHVCFLVIYCSLDVFEVGISCLSMDKHACQGQYVSTATFLHNSHKGMEQVHYVLIGNDFILSKAGKPKWRSWYQLQAAV
jgi:hypothetical protein